MVVARVTGRRLQRIRRRWFALFPLCVTCEAAGRVVLAVELDHRVPLFKGGADDDDNRQGLCVECHAMKTAADLGHGPAPGCDAEGWPTDPRHPWNLGRG